MSQENTIEPHNQTENSEINASSSSNPFAYTAKDLSLFFTPQIKDFSVLKKFGGIDGLIKGLHTDSQAGLSSDEIALLKPISLKEITGDVDVSTESEQDNTNDVQPPGPMPVEGSPFYQRISVFGRNILPERKSKSIFELMWIALQDKILILLTIAAVVSLALGLYEDFGVKENHEPGQPKIRWVEGVAIIIAILIVVLVGSLNDWQKERRFQQLNARKEDRNVKVMRNGKESLLSVHDILVGDVLFLEPGDIIATDGVLISGHNLRCDESAATGESDAVRKVKYADRLKLENEGVNDHKVDPFILSGSKVLEGVGTYLVTGIGVNSFYGKILMSLRGEAEDTPLQEKLNDLAEKIAKLGGAAALLMFIVLLIKYFVGFRNGVPSVTDAFDRLIKIIISTITVVVVAVPEGLPLAVTLALSYATIRMLKDNNLVRVLSACETMGNATTICSDKTGTLTQNKMTVVAGVIGSTVAFVRDVDAHSAHSEEHPQSTELALLEKPISLQEVNPALPKDILQLLNESIAINSTAFEGDPEDGKKTFVGSKTETALLSFLLDLKLDNIKSLRENAQIAQVFPFNSERKSMGVAIKVSDSKWRFYVKGASEIILKKTGSIVNIIKSDDGTPTGSVMNLTQDHYDNVFSIIENYATRSLRTIGLAYREFEQWPPKEMTKNDDNEVSYEELFDKLTLLGIVGIEDPLREGVREAVKHCINAGVKVRMVTGDNILTAKSIATQCGIFTGGVVMEGPAFRNLTDEQMDQMLPKLQVLARSSPDDKRILVGRLKKLGDTVAVTGDGTNDGPALKLSDVGFSMGIAGTEVAKEASSIILMDDNFSSIVKAIMWGRNVNDAVKKFLQFQLTVNVTAVLLTFITAVSSDDLQSVLSAVQLLWVNLIMDTFAALALATDPPTWDLLNRKPEPRSAPLISVEMWKMIIGQSIFQLVITLLLFYAGDAILGYDTPAEMRKKQTVIFNTFVFFQIFNEINCRRLDSKINIFKGALANKFLIVISIIMVAGQILIVQFGGAAFQVEPIDIIQWLICVGLGFLSLPVGVIIRLIPIENFRISSTSTEADVDLEKDWNDAIKQVQSQLKIFKTLRGGRFRAHFGDRKEKSEKRSKAFMAAAMLPSLISASVGVQLRENTGGENNENIKAEDPKLSEKQNAPEKSENPNASEKSENQNAPEEKSESQNVDKIEIQ